MDTFVLEATFEDLSVRLFASLDTVRDRARDLAAMGWRVEIRDGFGRAVTAPAEGGMPATTEPAIVEAVSMIDEDDLPPPPIDLDATFLRHTG